jgi:hypothetical protein
VPPTNEKSVPFSAVQAIPRYLYKFGSDGKSHTYAVNGYPGGRIGGVTLPTDNYANVPKPYLCALGANRCVCVPLR